MHVHSPFFPSLPPPPPFSLLFFPLPTLSVGPTGPSAPFFSPTGIRGLAIFGPPLCTRGSIVQAYDWTIIIIIVAQSSFLLFFVIFYGRRAPHKLAAVGEGWPGQPVGRADPLPRGGRQAVHCLPWGR